MMTTTCREDLDLILVNNLTPKQNPSRSVDVSRTKLINMGTSQASQTYRSKWATHSSVVIILSFILLFDVGIVRVGDCASTEDSNDIGTRHLDKLPGKSMGGRQSSGISGSHHHSHKKDNNHDSNEVHSTSFRFPGGTSGGDLEDGEEEDSYDDEDASYYDHDNFAESDEIKPEDVEYLDYYEKVHPPPAKPQIAKCCPPGEAFNNEGKCKAYRSPSEARHNQMEWFPKQVFDGANFTDTNMSEWDIQTAHNFQCGPNESTEIVSDLSSFAILQDGNLYLLKQRKLVVPLQFCVDLQLGRGEGHVVKSCFSRQELSGGCVGGCLRKCCPDQSFVDERSSRCARHSNLSDSYNFNNGNWTVLHEKPDCKFGHSLLALNGTFSVNDVDGSLVTPDFTAPFLQYCLDHFTNLKSHEEEELGDTPVIKVLMCFNKTQDENEEFDSQGLHSISVGFATVIGIALVFSATSIAIAALVSWRLPELRSLHGKCQLSHLATLFCLFICLAIVQLGREKIPLGLCKFFAVFIHTCALSSFLWLNLLCFNIYMTFRSLRPPLAARRDENRRLFFLCIYAWGIPASFVAFLFVLDSQPGRLEPMPRPDYGVLKCLMSSRDAEFAYLFGPVGVLLLINGLLFCLTAQELLCGLWRLDNSDSITFRRKSMGLVVAKLGIVMGMGWILDVLSWGFGRKFHFLFYAGDVFNALQGVFICIVLLWRKRVLEVLHLRKPSITKDETMTVRPFLPKNGVINTSSHADNDTSLVIVQDQ